MLAGLQPGIESPGQKFNKRVARVSGLLIVMLTSG
jgi:hypothetical protein